MLPENVIKLNTTEIYDQIQKYLNSHGYNSDKTKLAYKQDIRQFFNIVKQKEIQYLSNEDIQLTLDDFEDFIEVLHKKVNTKEERQYSNATINRKVKAVRGLIKYLAGKKLVKDAAFLSLIKNLPEVKNSHGILEFNEVLDMAELALKEKRKGENKRLAILFSFDTCARISEVVGLKWSNFVAKEDVVLVKGIGKGNKEFRQTISNDFYNELLKIKTPGEELVFQISTKRLTDTIGRLREELKIPKERNIVFHSIRKAGANWRFRVTNDILEAKRSLNHSSLTTTQVYLDNQDYGILGAVSTSGKLDMDLFKKVDLETLIKALENSTKNTQMLVNLKVKEELDKI